MRPLLAVNKFVLILPAVLSSVLGSCGGAYFVGFVSNPGALQQVSGTVQSVSVASAETLSGISQMSTAVVFVVASATSTLYFCGDQSSLFAINQFVTVSFTPGVYCSTITAIMTG